MSGRDHVHVVTGKDIEAFCLSPRVVDADRWEQLEKIDKMILNPIHSVRWIMV